MHGSFVAGLTELLKSQSFQARSLNQRSLRRYLPPSYPTYIFTLLQVVPEVSKKKADWFCPINVQELDYQVLCLLAVLM